MLTVSPITVNDRLCSLPTSPMHGRAVIEADADRERRLAVPHALGVPVVERGEHHLGAAQRVERILPGFARQPEHREDRVADIFLDGAAAGEDLRRHPLVELRSIVTTASGGIVSAMRVKPTISTNSTATVCRRTAPSGSSRSASISTRFGEK